MTMSSTLNEKQFAIIPAIGFTLEKIWADRYGLLRVAVAPFCALTLIGMADLVLTEEALGSGGRMAWMLGSVFLTLFILAPLCIRWHRAVILGEDVEERGPLFPETTGSYVVTQILIALVLFAVGVLLLFPLSAVAMLMAGGDEAQQIMVGLAPLVLILAFAVTARFNIILSAISVGDSSLGFRQAWDLTQHNGLRLSAGLLMILVLAGLVSIFIALPISPFLTEDAGLTVRAIAAAMGVAQGIVFNLIVVGYFSRAYLHFRGRSGPPALEDS